MQEDSNKKYKMELNLSLEKWQHKDKFISQESGTLDKNKLERNAVLPKQRIYSKDFENRYYGTSLQRKMRLATHFT